MGRGSVVCLFEQPVNIVNRSDVLSVIKVDFSKLSVGICGGAIGNAGFKLCVKPLRQCTIQKYRRVAAVFVPKNISSLNVYVFITVSSQMKNQVWLTTSATIEKVGSQFEQS